MILGWWAPLATVGGTVLVSVALSIFSVFWTCCFGTAILLVALGIYLQEEVLQHL